MAQHWRAEVVVDEELARSLVRAQFPEIPAESAELVAAGWDYTIHRIDGAHAFRFPRREVVLEPMRRELRVLPLLEPLVRVPLPVATHLGRPSGQFPWPFYGAGFLPGGEASAADGAALARPLAAALRRLHAPATVASAPGLPVDVVGRADMRVRVPRTRDEIEAVAAEGLWTAPAAAFELLRRAERLPPPGHLAVCHGDLHFRQVLVNRGRLSGVVDWVDVCLSDPGIDLQIAFSLLEGPSRAAFFDEYGPVRPASLLRARVLALFLSAVLARYGRAEGDERIEREAVASLDRALTDP